MRDVPNDIEEAFYAGQRTSLVAFTLNDPVWIVSGPYAGLGGAVISIEATSPEVILLVETETGEDVMVPAEALRLLREDE